MILVVTGSRNFQNKVTVFRKLIQIRRYAQKIAPTEKMTILVGDCPTGADKLTLEWMKTQSATVRYMVFKADWSTFGRKAGPLRNQGMVTFAKQLGEERDDEPVYCIGFLKNGAKNAGTINCLKEAENLGIQTFKYWGE